MINNGALESQYEDEPTNLRDELRIAKRTESLRRRAARVGTADFEKVRTCFWTWPFGHRYKPTRSAWNYACVGCGKTKKWSLYA